MTRLLVLKDDSCDVLYIYCTDNAFVLSYKGTAISYESLYMPFKEVTLCGRDCNKNMFARHYVDALIGIYNDKITVFNK